MKKEYTNGDVTVTWEPEKCIHSKVCWTSLSSVFNPKVRPWININGDSTNTIIAQVKQCPSGALGYIMNNTPDDIKEIKPDHLVIVSKSGPLMVHGKLTVKHHDGSIIEKVNVTAFCRCGASANKPFCDGSHRNINFE